MSEKCCCRVPSVVKKYLMAVTGLVLVLFLIVHVVGNLQMFQAPEKINTYAHLLHALPPVALWGFRVVILTCIVVHFALAIKLKLENLAARVSHYCEKTNSAKAFVCFEYVSGESATGIKKVFSCLPSVEYATVRSNGESDGIRVCDTYRALADLVVDRNESERLTLIIGSLEFTESLKGAIKAKIDRL